MKRKMLLVPLALLLIVSLVACAAPAPAPAPTPAPAPAPAPKPMEVIEWTLDTYFPPPPAIYVSVSTQEVCDRINARLEGRFVITPVFGSSLGVKGPDVATALGEGAFEADYVAFPYLAGDIPVLGAIGLPALLRDNFEGFAAHDVVTPYYRSELEKRNIKLIGSPYLFPRQVVWSKQPLKETGDFKGLTFRGFSPEHTMLLDELESIVISISMPEVYTALERGMLDAILGSTASAQAVSAWEVLDYGIDVTFALADSGLIVNKDAWEALPAEYQLVITEEANRTATELNYKSIMEEEKGWAMLAEKGITKITPSPQMFEDMVKVAGPVWDIWAQEKVGAAADALAWIRVLLSR